MTEIKDTKIIKKEKCTYNKMSHLNKAAEAEAILVMFFYVKLLMIL